MNSSYANTSKHIAGEFFALKGYSNTDDISRHFSVHNFERNGDHIVFIIDGMLVENIAFGEDSVSVLLGGNIK